MTISEMISLLGGVGLFLYGMTLMSGGLKNAAGDRMRDILDKVTSNRILGVIIGLVVTVLIQSSSATDMMVIGFVHAGLMTLGEAIGVIMGANIGTTITAQITAFNLSAFAPFLVFAGCCMQLFLRKSTLRHIGGVILGFGMLFVGIGMMKSAIEPLSQSESFVRALSAFSHPAAAVLFGLAFTALLQSSSSSVVIFQAFAVEGLLQFDQCVYLIIGAAIGSVTPNLLASLTMGRNGKRAALLNLFFNLFRAAFLLVAIAIFPGILDAIQRLSPGDIARQVANAHTLFSIAAVVVMLPFSGRIADLTLRVLPLLPEERRSIEERRLVYLDQMQRGIPAIAMRQAMLEVNRMGELSRRNLSAAIDYFMNPQETTIAEQVLETEKTVDFLDHAISDRLVEMRSMQLSDRDVFRLSRLIRVTSNFERVSDHAENIVEFAQRMSSAKAVISEEAMAELRTMGDTVLKTLDVSMEVFREERFDLIPQAEALEQRVDDMQETYMQNHIERLMREVCDPLGGVIFTDMCTDLERCSDQAINIATALSTRNQSNRLRKG